MPKDTYLRLSKEKQDRIYEAALNEFSKRNFNEAKLSNIIKEAKIPRGSIYQYFEDKKDLYKYIFDRLGQVKIEYMSDLIPNSEEIPFLDLIRQLYVIGIKYASENPKAVKMAKFLFNSSDSMFDEILGDGLKQANKFYQGYIETDKRLGRINPDIDTKVFAAMMSELITNISLDELKLEKDTINLESMLDKFDKKLFIIEKGILTGDKNV